LKITYSCTDLSDLDLVVIIRRLLFSTLYLLAGLVKMVFV
jgi:hypothetical protein